MQSESLERISQRDRVFLTRTAVLERMCGPLCDAVLELSGSAAILADLAQSNLLLVPLDRTSADGRQAIEEKWPVTWADVIMA
jgi:LuxR family maltose regulon positive regulatory protein